MSTQRLPALLLATLHWISPVSRQVVETLAGFGGAFGADLLARRLGLRTRHRLARMLARDGLPPLQELRSWIRLVAWVLEWEGVRASLFRTAIAQDLDPAACYRVDKKLTRASWTEVRSRGVAWVVLKLGDRCHVPRRTPRKQRAAGTLPPLASCHRA